MGFGGSGLYKDGDYCIINMVITQLPQGKQKAVFNLHSMEILTILLKWSF